MRTTVKYVLIAGACFGVGWIIYKWLEPPQTTGFVDYKDLTQSTLPSDTTAHKIGGAFEKLINTL